MEKFMQTFKEILARESNLVLLKAQRDIQFRLEIAETESREIFKNTLYKEKNNLINQI